MGFDFSELDAQLAALGGVRSDILQTARRFAGVGGALADVDQALAALSANVNLGAATAAPVVGAKRVNRKATPQLVSSPAASPDAERFEPNQPAPKSVAPPASVPAPAVPPPRNGPPHSEEIALPEPVQHESAPHSGELSLDDAAPRSGSFALDPTPAESNLDEDTDADFEAEFAALSGPEAPLAKPSTPRPKTVQPPAKPESLKPAPKAESFKPAARSADDEETDAVLALFDAANEAESLPAPTKAPAVGGLSAELEPSIPPPAGNRDPDAEFDALFDEASSPSSMPAGPAPGDQDSVDDLLRDLGSPRVPQDLLPKASARPAKALNADDDDLGEDPTGIFDMSAFDSVTGGESAAAKGPNTASEDDDFEIDMEIDDVMEEEDESPKPPSKGGKPMVAPPRPPPQPPGVPGGVEKRPSFLGRLFGGPSKDPADDK